MMLYHLLVQPIPVFHGDPASVETVKGVEGCWSGSRALIMMAKVDASMGTVTTTRLPPCR